MTSIKILGFTKMVRVLWRVPGFKFHGLWVNFHMDIVQSTHLMNKWEKNSISSFSHESPVNHEWKIINPNNNGSSKITVLGFLQNKMKKLHLHWSFLGLKSVPSLFSHNISEPGSSPFQSAKQYLTLTIMIITGNQV